MVSLTIDRQTICVPKGSSILEAAAKLQIHIPTLCHIKDVNEVGACRICGIEIEGFDHLVTACNTAAEDGMVVYTDTEAVRRTRKTNVEFMLSQHDCHCPTCVRNGNCSLQTLAGDMNVSDFPYGKRVPKNRWDKTLPLIREESKCVKCLRCVSVCEKVQSLGVWELAGSGSRATVAVRDGADFTEAGCSYCGQCITHCPVGALHERDDTEKFFSVINDPEKTVVIQIAPAVRAAWGDSLGIPAEIANEKRLVAAARALGADYVFDTNFTADLTIMEEGSEFLERMGNPEKYPMPMLTSCCPGWVRFLKEEYPELMDQLSTAKSPQQMFGAVAKSYFAGRISVPKEDIVCVSIMPCIAKKYECDVAEINDAAEKDVDIVLTTREFGRMLRAKQIHIPYLPEEEFDSPMGEGTGAAVIFGTTGGVMEAALRSAYFLITGENPKADAFQALGGQESWRAASFDINGTTVRVAVASGLGHARVLLEAVKAGVAQYDFIEVMACPGGCAGGGGQPICDGKELASARGTHLRRLDQNSSVRFSYENQEVRVLYEELFGAPLSQKAHELLHTNQKEWTM